MEQLQLRQPLSSYVLGGIGLLIGAILMNVGAAFLHVVMFGFFVSVPLLAYGPGLMAREMISMISIPKDSYVRRWIIMGVVLLTLSSIIAAWTTADFFRQYDFRHNTINYPIGYSPIKVLIIWLITLISPTLIAFGIRRQAKLSITTAIVWWLVSWIIVLLSIPVTWVLGIYGMPFSA